MDPQVLIDNAFGKTDFNPFAPAILHALNLAASRLSTYDKPVVFNLKQAVMDGGFPESEIIDDDLVRDYYAALRQFLKVKEDEVTVSHNRETFDITLVRKPILPYQESIVEQLLIELEGISSEDGAMEKLLDLHESKWRHLDDQFFALKIENVTEALKRKNIPYEKIVKALQTEHINVQFRGLYHHTDDEG